MISIQAKAQFIDEEHDQAVVAVQTSRTFYRVAIRGSEVTVIAPGLEEPFNLGDTGLEIEHLSYEGIATICVLAVEERL